MKKIFLCIMTLEAGWEAAEYIKTIRGDKTVKTIFWWDAPQVWEWWYGLKEKPDLEKEFIHGLWDLVPVRYSDIVKINKARSKYGVKFKDHLNADWTTEIITHGHLIIESDGFDVDPFIEMYFKADERKKWLNMLDEISKKYMLKENLRKEYTIILENKI